MKKSFSFSRFHRRKISDDEFIFQHDLAPLQTPLFTKNWLREHQINIVPRSVNLTDLNQIENLLVIKKER